MAADGSWGARDWSLAHTDGPAPPGPDRVQILLAMLNGGDMIAAQLDSLDAQIHRDWTLLVSDDGSTDAGPDAVRAFARRIGSDRVRSMPGPGRGFAANFLHLLTAADPACPYTAFCDQDDVWLPQKLRWAITALKAAGPDRPAVYCGRTLHCDRALAPTGVSPRFRRPPDFRNALLQNIGGGNTMVLNRAALRLVRRACQRVDDVVSHDWWIYQLVTGSGGVVVYEDRPGLLYRQHDGNAVGANGSARATLGRLMAVLQGRFRDWTDCNVDALDRVRDMLTPDHRQMLDQFRAARRQPALARMAAFRRLGLYRQHRHQTLAAWLFFTMGRI